MRKTSELYEKYGDIFYKTGKPKKMYKACYRKEYVNELRKHDKSIGAGMVCAGHSCPYFRTRACGEACLKEKPTGKVGRWMKENWKGDKYMSYTTCSLCGKRGYTHHHPYCPWCGKPMRVHELWYGDILSRNGDEIVWKEGG